MSNAAVKTRYRSERYGYSTGMWSTCNFETIDKAIAYGTSAKSCRVYDEFTKKELHNVNYNEEFVPPLFLKLYETNLYETAQES